MKAKFLFTLIFSCIFIQLLAQTNPLVGTWIAVSIKGTDPDGKPMSMDGSEFVETKIITPTHYALITHMKSGDSLVFEKAIAGTVRVEGNKYYETAQYFSGEGFDKAKTDFTYTIEGDRFIQKGIITQGEKVFKLDELIFQKVKLPAQNNPAIGTWSHLSSSGVNTKGEKWSNTKATHNIFQIITPTHWMRINHKDNKFENAYGGTYRMEGNKMYPNFEMISFTPPKGLKVELVQRIEANKLQWNVIVNNENGKSVFENVFEKADAKMAKTSSTK